MTIEVRGNGFRLTGCRRLVVLAMAGAITALGAPGAVAYEPPQTRIIAGTPAGDTQFPYQARLSIRRGTKLYQCGAVIRDATHVMTAAHCVTDSSGTAAASDVTVYYGSADRTRQRLVTAYEVHPAAQYQAGDGSWDAALITLSSSLVGYGGSTVNGMPLATASESATAVAAGATATVSGWGMTEQGSLPTTLRSTNVTLRRDDVCSATYRPADFVPSRFVCAGGTGTAQNGNPDSCGGDSGGPLVTSTPSGVRLVGLVSFGPNSGCGQRGIPAAYTEVSNPSIAALLTGTTAEAPATVGAAPNSGAGGIAPGAAQVGQTTTGGVPLRPVSPPTAASPTRLSARITSVRCVRSRCTIRAAANGTALTASIAQRVRRCKARKACRTVWKTVTTRSARRSGGGYTLVARLRPGSYRVGVVARNGAGARSSAAQRAFRVHR